MNLLHRIIYLKKQFLAVFLAALLACPFYGHVLPPERASAKTICFVVLNCYKRTMKIGEECYLIAVSSDGSLPSFKSSKSGVASVNTYGLITAKSAGTCKITAKVRGGEASCRITVAKTAITLNKNSISLENGGTFRLLAKTSNNSAVSFTSSKKSIAEIDETGLIIAKKPGNTVISVKADKTTAKCNVTVKPPTIKLSHSSVSMYRNETIKLSASVSSGFNPKWKSGKKSVASVDELGNVTANKHGTAIISATVDGVTKTCEITVKPPTIKLNRTSITMKPGQSITLAAKVSSGNKPVFKSSKQFVATVTQNGKITAKKAGTAIITVKEDGTSVTCHIIVKRT